MYKNSYIGDGVIFEFFFEFPFFQPGDVRVAVNDKIMDDCCYSVSCNENLDGGSVLFLTPPPSNAKVDIFRQISLSRPIDYQPTAKITPENLNVDFNFLLEAFKDLKGVEIDLAQWRNVFDNIKQSDAFIRDKMSGGTVLGIYKNLLCVLTNCMPRMINDYGSLAVPSESCDDYGLL